ncbi:MAG: BatA domain-containing protein [Pirellulaceae bacterium]
MTVGSLSLLALFGEEAFLTSTGLMWAGVAAISIPVIIHLLNKRKFKIVDWAAMEFLLDADKKNRRRVRLENLLLLLLRCLAVLLIGLLLARPFIPTSLTAGILSATQYERIVIVDDSLSMQARVGNESAWDQVRLRLTRLTEALANDQSDNTLTLILTSQPDQPQFNGTALNKKSIGEINETIDKLEVSDKPANLDGALKQLQDRLSGEKGNVSRVVYVITDLRQRDWKDSSAGQESPLKTLLDISKVATHCYVVDAGDAEDRNLTVTEIRPEGTLVAGVASRFDVTVSNQGSSEARDVRIKFGAGDSLPLQEEIERLAPGATESRSFSFTFSAEDENAEAALRATLPPRKVKVEVTTAKQGEDDRLPADSVAYYPARIVRGIPALIVDGDPSAAFGKAESFYLKRSLTPNGPVPSGVVVDVVTESEMESLTLDKYGVIFLCNVYRLGDKTVENIEKLRKWVEAGGGLVMMPGDQVDEAFFNDNYYKDGSGLSPFKLENIKGDEAEKKWVNLRVDQANHEVLKVFAGQNNPFLDKVKTFRWWGSSIKKDQLGSLVSVPARFNDIDDSAAFAEKPVGRGRVLATTIPADADWSNWTSDPSYLISMQELVRYMSGDRGDKGLVRVGEPLRQALDLTQYELDAAIEGPKEKKANIQAASGSEEEAAKAERGAPEKSADSKTTADKTAAEKTPADKDGKGENVQQKTIWQLEYKDTDLVGFYEMKLNRREGGLEPVLFAANVDPTEGNLKRVDTDTMKKEIGDANIHLVKFDEAISVAGGGAQTEIWWYLLWAVVGILCCEQVLGWYFGLGRQ